MNHYLTPLDKFLSENNIKSIDLWRKINTNHKIDYSYLTRIRNGDRPPGRLTAKAIREAIGRKLSSDEIMYPEDYIDQLA